MPAYGTSISPESKLDVGQHKAHRHLSVRRYLSIVAKMSSAQGVRKMAAGAGYSSTPVAYGHIGHAAHPAKCHIVRFLKIEHEQKKVI